jgi:hypothetical protein
MVAMLHTQAPRGYNLTRGGEGVVDHTGEAYDRGNQVMNDMRALAYKALRLTPRDMWKSNHYVIVKVAALIRELIELHEKMNQNR